ncbi:MFS transporter [Rubrivivax gelatinosus]|uniref:PPP family 3-phenylpropionic acid transporter n=1 Tax=Rubrivivax gelatinosus TaxID=28068 RepID=A0A4R2M906_RUBGE|nr:MFS transporter [Rubrivivax gelatinosus]MBK1686853.1 MFS transporter [Rubrivivax gelatinosus]TCP01445.1 PPP family 3-phenylpropionic acid transporter [Rubrivivax gelatinosus]
MSPAPTGLRAFGAVWFVYFAGIALFNPYAPLWFKELGFSTLLIGAVASLQSWTRVVAPYGWGWWADHGGGRVRLIRLAAAIALAAAAGFLVARGEWAVAACTAALFLANGAIVPLSEAALAARLSAGGGFDASRYGRVRVWGSIGFVVSVVAAGALLQRQGIALFPLLLCALYALLLGVALRLPGGGADAAPTTAPPPVLPVLRRPAVAWFFASVALTVLAHTALYAFFSLLLDARGYPKSAVGALWAVSVLVEIVFFWFQGQALGRFDAYRWLQWAGLASALRFALTAVAGASTALLVLAQLLHALTFAAHHAASIVLVSRHFPGALRTRGQALYSVLGYGVPGVIGGLAGGWVAEHHGLSTVFWLAAVAGLGGAAAAAKASKCDVEVT